MNKNNVTIKKETIEEVKNPTKKDKLANLDWKMKMRLAVITGAKVKCLNEEQTQYHNFLLEKKKKYEEKLKSLEKKKQDKINEIKLNAEAQVERILDSMIAKEQKDIDLQAAEDRAKEKAKEKIEAKIKAKEERRFILSKSIPTPEIIKENKKQQEFLAKAHTEKLEAIQKRAEEKAKIEEEKLQESIERRAERHLKAKERALASRKNKGPKTHSTKEERITAVIERKKQGKANYEAELKRQQEQYDLNKIEADKKRAERKRKETERLMRIAERRKARKDKIIAVELKQKEKTRRDLERWKESETRRLAKKAIKAETYLTKGGKEVPKVKNKVEARIGDTSRLAKVKTTELKQYAVVIGNLTDRNNIVDTLPHIIKCIPKTLNNHVKGFHEEMMKAHKDVYVGTFVYPIDDMSHCIFEMINNDRLTIDGKLTSRLAAQKEETIKKLSAA